MGIFRFSISNNLFRLSWLSKELVYGAHLTSFSATCIILSIIIILDLPLDITTLVAAYLMTYIVYSYNYQNEIEDDVNSNPEKYEYLTKRKFVYPYLIGFSIVSLILLLLYINNIKFIIFMAILFSGGILYTTVFKVLTQYVPGFKSIYVSTMLTYFVIFYTLFLYSLYINIFFIFVTLLIFIKLFINIVYFDIKDIETDWNKKLKTLPILLGRIKTIYFLYIVNIIASFILIFGIYNNIFPLYTISLLIFSLYTFFYLYKGMNATKKSLLFYTYIMADAEFIFWPIVLIIMKAIIQ